jgi:hypothetical protein
MRLFGESLYIFFNEKVAENSFSMEGRLFRLHAPSLTPNLVRSVFENRNWGWDPWIDEEARVHHKDSETQGNPYMIEREVQKGRDWHELARTRNRWIAENSAFPSLSGSDRTTGYLRFIDVNPNALIDLHTVRPTLG